MAKKNIKPKNVRELFESLVGKYAHVWEHLDGFVLRVGDNNAEGIDKSFFGDFPERIGFDFEEVENKAREWNYISNFPLDSVFHVDVPNFEKSDLCTKIHDIYIVKNGVVSRVYTGEKDGPLTKRFVEDHDRIVGKTVFGWNIKHPELCKLLKKDKWVPGQDIGKILGYSIGRTSTIAG